MQVARDMFLTPRRDMKRKMSEVYISLLMEAEFTKEEIFSLYVNKIFLGQRAYGVAAAAEVYFGKTLDQLSIAEMATLAGIPTAPSAVNPVANPEAATNRRAHVLGRMLETGLHHAGRVRGREGEPDGEPAARALHRGGRTVRRRDGAQRYAGQIRRCDLYRGLSGLHHHRFAAPGRRDGGPADRVCWNTIAATAGEARRPRSICRRTRSAADLEAELEEFPVVGGLRPAIVEKVETRRAPRSTSRTWAP